MIAYHARPRFQSRISPLTNQRLTLLSLLDMGAW